ncbi:MAG: hypothetical protein ACT6U0_02320 [Shinella sp.]|uniref:hypothetical protein n=1 Tax=Shinella sp. TaxID=1870904 RepID=UPI004035896E
MNDTEPTQPLDRRPELPARRRDAARHLLHPLQLRGSMALSPLPCLRNAVLAGFQAAITAEIALPLFHLSPWSHLIGFASLGALVALFGRFALFEQVLERGAATAIVSALAWAICVASEAFRHHPTPERPFPVDTELPLGDRVNAAARSTAAAGIAVFVSCAFAVDHPA